MSYSDYEKRREKSSDRRSYYSNVVDIETGIQLTGMVWANLIEIDGIVLVDLDDMEFLQGD